jgi:lysophospholipase L1-like esterase
MRWPLLPFLVFGCFLDSGCARTTATYPQFIAKSDSFLALGDSYTIGTAISESERWPTLLASKLQKRGILLSEPMILAQNGWTTDALLAALDQAKPVGPFRLVTLMIGVNDQYIKRKPDDFRPRFAALLDRSLTLAGSKPEHVLVLSIPDYNYGPPRKFAPQDSAAKIDQLNAVIREETARRGMTLADITPLSRLAIQDADLRAQDGLHFSELMHEKWADYLFPLAIKALAP